MDEERRKEPARETLDVTGAVAILYTFGFIVLAGMLYFYPIPATNKDALLYLFGILSGIEMSIIAFLYGGSKAAEAIQRSAEARQGRSEAIVQEIAKAAPTVVTVAATTPDGTIPAKEVAEKPKGTT